ncbi:TetR/AcrR family transcriptional regulator [Streptomyces sp. CC77]|uniref:TetR/AcrR family transcriptional regulator n=1 Tax=Streptomyces sp. CC77 TaxID=1906739 RepID=UPI0008DEA6BF|nr:TetR/AcrR family transcriptional regulator [Streptomyces sp. CC77]OII66486.1 TetR family transcriptional regulator [Streptomyces sp. CC77]
MARNAAPRVPLDRERVLRAAVEIADEGGVGSLTMRRIAERLGVEAMSLYHHVANKSDILDGMVDTVFGEIDLPAPDEEWRQAMRRRAVSARDALTRHPWAVGLMDSRATPGPETLRHHDAVIGCLRGAGFSLALTAHAVSVIDSYLYGFVLQERALPFRTEQELAAVADTIMERMPDDAHPYLTEMMSGHALRPDYRYADEFAFGLDLILDGLARLA